MSREELTREEFYERIKEDIRPLLPESTGDISVQKIEKNNSEMKTGLLIQSKEVNVSPTIYLEGFYDRYVNGALYHNVLHEIAQLYTDSLPQEDFNLDLLKWEYAKDNVICKLINYERNRDMLSNMPHRKVEDLAIVYLLSVADPKDGMATIKISNQIQDRFGVDEETLYTHAKENMHRLYPPSLNNMLAFLSAEMGSSVTNMLDVDPDEGEQLIEDCFSTESPMYVLTNEQKINGAIYALEHDVMDKIAAIIGDKYFVLPSSVHDVIVIPFDGDYEEYKYWEAMVRKVNATQILPEELLSNHVYLADAKAHTLRLAETEYKLQKKKLEAMKGKDVEAEKEQEVKGPKL